MLPKRHNPFRLRDFRGVARALVRKLEVLGIKNAEQILTKRATKIGRRRLAKDARIPEGVVLEIVKPSDLARLPGIKGIRAQLYYEAGVDTTGKMAAWAPEALRRMVADHVERTGFDGIPLPSHGSPLNGRECPKAAAVHRVVATPRPARRQKA